MRFIDALLPVLELATEQCRKLVSEPTVAAPVNAPGKGRKRTTLAEQESPQALGKGIARFEVEALRPEERSLLRFIRNNGPITLRQLAKRYRVAGYHFTAAVRLRVLPDLDRFGLIAGYSDAYGNPIVHATEKAEPLLDCEPGEPWKPRAPKRG